jgi:hypothetical protein
MPKVVPVLRLEPGWHGPPLAPEFQIDPCPFTTRVDFTSFTLMLLPFG